MRRLVLLSMACVATATAAAVVEPAAPAIETRMEPPAPQTATEATLQWIAALEAASAAQQAEPLPPIEPPDFGEVVPGSGIRRCAGADGTVIFTDRTCEHHGAVPSAAPSAGNASTRLFVRSCARTREQLVDGLRDALGAQDANRVASYYHWTGMGNRAAYALMDRLQRFSARPLMDVQLVASAALAATARSDTPLGWYPMLPPHEPGLALPVERPPDLVRVDQMRGENDAGSEVTYFRLLPNAGCWWVRY